MKTDTEKPGQHATSVSRTDVEFIEKLLHAILDDTFNLVCSYRSADCAKDKSTITRRLKSEGAGFASVALPRLFNQLLLVLEGEKPSFEGFKKNPASRLPVFLGRLTRMVVEQEPEDISALKCIYMLCVAFKKLKGPYPQEVLSKTLDKFVADDESLLGFNFNDPAVRQVSLRAKRYIDILFKDIDTFNIVPKPGPGAVNTPLKPYLRYEPHVRYLQLDEVFPYRNWFYTNAWGFKSSVRNYFALPQREYPKSRMKFVHKYVGKPRGICIEENETQYLQQGLKAELYSKIENHPMTKGRVNFESQDINRDLALKSSSDKSHCTIDMSEGSNRIVRDGVFFLFRDTPYLDYLDALSTKVITFPREVRRGFLYAQKFAPMGSAICFPIMAIVHWSLIKAMVSLSGIANAKEASKHIYVYGDDIIVPNEFTEHIFTMLPKFGMKLNMDKSYFRSYFRESCGIHAYKGVDITPVYNNYTLTSKHESKDSTRLLSTLAKEYLYHKSDMLNTAAVIRKHIFHIYGHLPYGKATSRLLCFKRDAHFVLHQKGEAFQWRYNADYQCKEYLVRLVCPRFNGQLSLLGSGALLRWFNTSAEESARFMDFDALKIVRRWVLESDLG